MVGDLKPIVQPLEHTRLPSFLTGRNWLHWVHTRAHRLGSYSKINLYSSFNRTCLLQKMACTNQMAQQGSNLGKSRAMFHRKAAKGVARAWCRAPKYYMVPSLGLDEQGKPKRWCPGVASLLEIRYYQKHVKLLIPLLAFSRLVWGGYQGQFQKL